MPINDKVVLVINQIKESELKITPSNLTTISPVTNETIVLTATPVGLEGKIGPTGPTGPQGEKGDPGNFFGIESLNECTGQVGMTGSENEIVVVNNCPDIVLGFPENVTIQGNLDVLGNINIFGQLNVDGLIITKTGFQGYTLDADLELIDGVYLDGGEY